MRGLLLALLLSLPLGAQTPEPAGPPAPRTLTMADHEKVVRLKPGEVFLVRLPVDKGKGLEWEIFYKNSQLKRLGNPAHTSDLVVYTFEPEAPFEDSLELRYFKPAAKKPRRLRTFKVELRVQEDEDS